MLLVGNHSGGTLIADTFAFAYEFYRHFGADRTFHQLAHDMVFQVPGLGMLRKYGTVPASHEEAERALERGALSVRGFDRVLRVAWTLADLAGLPTPGADQVAEALGMRLQRAAA